MVRSIRVSVSTIANSPSASTLNDVAVGLLWVRGIIFEREMERT